MINIRQVIYPALVSYTLAAQVFASKTANAQSADEHKSHHPGQAEPKKETSAGMPMSPAAPPTNGMAPGMPMTSPAAPSTQPAGTALTPGSQPVGPAVTAGMGGMMGMMSGMMKGSDAKTPIYPILMTLPSLPPEKRAEIEDLATQQMRDGANRFREGSVALEQASKVGDFAAMQQAVNKVRQGLDELGAGLSARRVLTEGKAPRNLALDWFKREMSLSSPIYRVGPDSETGDSILHIFVMILLLGFSVTMIAMYFFKIRRAAALFGRFEPPPSTPPPGSAPPLGGSPGTASGLKSQSTPSITSEGSKATSAHHVPLTANWRGKLQVTDILRETPTVKTLRLVPTLLDTKMPFSFIPGQFINVAFSIGGARMNRSYSILSAFAL